MHRYVVSELHTWSRLDRLLGSWLRAWYWPRNRSPAAIFLNFFKSTTYRALVKINGERERKRERRHNKQV